MKRRQGKNIQTPPQQALYLVKKRGKTQHKQVSFGLYTGVFRVITTKTLHVENKLVNLRENYNIVNK